jgi:hypothetical protein
LPELLAPYWEWSTFWWKASIVGLLLMAFTIIYFCRFLEVHISPTTTGELHSHHPHRWRHIYMYIWRGTAWCPEGIICDTAITTSVSLSPWHNTLQTALVNQNPVNPLHDKAV